MELIRNHLLNLQIENESDIGVCRRKTVSLSKQLGFDEVKTGEVAILVTEMVTNVIKHGGGEGRILVCEVKSGQRDKGIEIWCCDMGNGIPDLELAMSDGFTNKGTLGIGLGSIRRFSDELEINPVFLRTTGDPRLSGLEAYPNCMRALKWLPARQWQGTNRSLLVGAASRSKPGENLNGDCYTINHMSPEKTLAAVIDGLGHGKEAHLASQLVREQLALHSSLPVNLLLEKTHLSTRGTRGAVIGLAVIDTGMNKLTFSGIGNIEGFILTANGKKNLISFGGILGHKIRTPRLFEFDFHPGDMLFLFSDGITGRWNIDDLDLENHPQQIAEYIINNHARQNDDATILIVGHRK